MIRCPECGREYQSRSGLRRHMKSQHQGTPAGSAAAPFDTSFDTGSALLSTTQDVAEEKSEPRGAGGKLIERALVDQGIDWEDVMSYQVHDDQIVIVEGPVGFKRTWWFPASGAKAGADVSGGTT